MAGLDASFFWSWCGVMIRCLNSEYLLGRGAKPEGLASSAQEVAVGGFLRRIAHWVSLDVRTGDGEDWEKFWKVKGIS
jgi:hypothetical protein